MAVAHWQHAQPWAIYYTALNYTEKCMVGAASTDERAYISNVKGRIVLRSIWVPASSVLTSVEPGPAPFFVETTHAPYFM